MAFQEKPKKSRRWEPTTVFSKGPRFLIGLLHLALAAALIVFVIRFYNVMTEMEISIVKVIYVPIGAFALAVFIAVRGILWMRRGEGGDEGGEH